MFLSPHGLTWLLAQGQHRQCSDMHYVKPRKLVELQTYFSHAIISVTAQLQI